MNFARLFSAARPLTFAFGVFAFGVFASGVAASAASAPDWLAAVARAPVTVPTKDADAVLLLEEGFVDIDREGVRTARTRRVFKVLNEDGRKHAVAQVDYLSDSAVVKSFKAWLIKPGGEVVQLAKKEIIDVALHSTALELYGEARRQMIRAADAAKPGAVFGYEAVVTSRRIVHQETWRFQNEVPTERSAFSLKLAPGWNATARWFNTPDAPPTVAAGVRTWTRTGLPALANEPMSPPAPTLAPWLAVDLVAPANSDAARTSLRSDSWPELSRTVTPKYDAASVPDAALRSQVQRLLAGAQTSWERMQRLCAFAQQVNYISILLDSGNAGGMIPRPAPRVLQCNYGDCKDKSTLLRTLLAEAGIKSYPLIVLAGGRSRLETDWPSPTQFNHCVLAIAVDGSVESSSIIDHPSLGRLLVFDPTDPFTPLGLLVRSRLADQALLLAGEQGGLIELPAARSEGDRLVRIVRAKLDPLGNLSGQLEHRYLGVAASAARAELHPLKPDDYRKRIEGRLASTLPALRGTQVKTVDQFAEAEFTQTIDFNSTGYGKLMRDELLIFKPALTGRRDASKFTKKPRTLPVTLHAHAYAEKAEFELPEDCVVDELAPALELETDFGRYRSTLRVEGNTLYYERDYELRSREIPAADYERVRVFFERIARNEQASVVLRRKLESTPTTQTGP